MPCDLLIPHQTVLSIGILELAKELKENGFTTIAIADESDGNLKKAKACSINIKDYYQKVNETTDEMPTLLTQLKPEKNDFKIYSRLTIKMTDPSQNYSLNKGNSVGDSYNLIAVQPTSEKLFQMACQQLEIDIISIDMSERLPFHLKSPSIKVALSRGVVFEITYGSALRDATARRNLITNATELIRKTKGKNVIVSSEARTLLELRGANDVIHLCTLFQMPPDMARNALESSAYMALMHGATRQLTYRAVVHAEDIKSLDDGSRKWKAARLETQKDVHTK